MRIAFISAGAAGMYCGSCLQDNTLAAKLQKMGHEVALIPTYTPIRTDEVDVSLHRVFYGAVMIYLQQKTGLFRHTPRMIDWLLNRPALLNLAARLGASTDPRELGALTLSVLQGEEGRQARELEILADWLHRSFRPDVVHLSNSMFLGMARRIRQEVAVPVVCSVQGEDLFLESLRPPLKDEVHAALRRRARDADRFIAPCRVYADFMAGYLDVPRDRIDVVPLGLDIEETRGERPDIPGPFVIGYMARVSPEKGLHVLAEAFRLLANRVGRDAVRLRVAGYLSPRDRAYLETVRARIRSWGLEDVFEYLGEVDRPAKIRFLLGLHVLSVPTVYRDPKGRFVLEALATGVPVVQPRHGAFPEMVERTGGGVLVDPDSPAALAEALQALMSDPARRAELGRRGKEAVRRDGGAATMAAATLNVYRAAGGAGGSG